MPHSAITVTGWDLGGAHLKACVLAPKGEVLDVVQLPCPLWKGLAHLREALRSVLAALPAGRMQHALTMTGEMVDLFADRAAGVRQLLGAFCEQVAPHSVHVYSSAGTFLTVAQALEAAAAVASANWHASAGLCARVLGDGLLIDVGSTTTDLVPFAGGGLRARGADDYGRMRDEELVYQGVVRTPVAAMANRAPFEGQWVPLMTEQFATAADVYRLVGSLPAHADLHPSADEGAKGVAESAQRVARMLGRDAASAPAGAWRRVAVYLAERQLDCIRNACERILSRGAVADEAPLVGAGVGRFVVAELARRMRRRYVDFGSLLQHAGGDGLVVADCAPAAAVARLLGETLWDATRH